MQHNVSRSYISVERIKRADTSRWIPAIENSSPRKYARNRDAGNNASELAPRPYWNRECANGAGLNAECEDLRVLLFLLRIG